VKATISSKLGAKGVPADERQVSTHTENGIKDKKTIFPFYQRDTNGKIIESTKFKPIYILRQMVSKIDTVLTRHGSDVAGDSYLIPLANKDKVNAALIPLHKEFENAKLDFEHGIYQQLENQCKVYPQYTAEIMSWELGLREQVRNLDFLFMSFPLGNALSQMTGIGVENMPTTVLGKVANDVAEIAKSITGSRYSMATLKTLERATEKAEGFAFLSEGLAAVRPAFDKVKSMINIYDMSPSDSIMLGGFIALLSNPQKLIDEGRKISAALDPVVEEITVQEDEPEMLKNGTDDTITF
jgi:hypothetical protein